MQSSPSIGALDQLLEQAKEKILVQKVISHQTANPEISWEVLRTDLIHPVCSGNKLFKLYYYLVDAIQKGHTAICTYGGAWSNHIVATAYAAQLCGLSATGYIRGEEPATWSQTLLDARAYGMELVFLPRSAFDTLALQEGTLQEPALAKSYSIPMGGYGYLGAKGAAMMLDYADKDSYSHILCAAGTGTMIAGLAMAAGKASLSAINVVKGFDLDAAVKKINPTANITISNDYQFGGYAKATDQLLDQMNSFYAQNSIPTDFVYTGKLMFAIEDLINRNAFPKGSKVLAIHSGGLQGNKSLKNGRLHF